MLEAMAATPAIRRLHPHARAAPQPARRARRLPVPRPRGQGHLRRQGEVDPQARRRPLLQPRHARRRRDGRPHPPDRLPARRLRGRGAAHRERVHQALQAALQHPPARRQVLSVPGDLARRGLSARVLHARAPPQGPRLLRAVLERQEGARHARPAAEGVRVSLLQRQPSRAGAAARRAWTTTSSAAGRPAWATSPRRSTARRSTASSRSSPAATARSSATSKRG